jgi:hypothetical protein
VEILALYDRVGTPLMPRTDGELMPFFTGFDMVDPGLVALTDWRPDTLDEAPAAGGPDRVRPVSDDVLTGFRAGVGRKP